MSFEVVPGIPAGLAAPAYAGIAIGHSLVAEVVTVIRGCEDDHRALADVDWSGVARVHGTVVCYAVRSSCRACSMRCGRMAVPRTHLPP
jgi:uroporphyrin-III C-methyltransferase